MARFKGRGFSGDVAVLRLYLEIYLYGEMVETGGLGDL
jgi:hypothetical protein